MLVESFSFCQEFKIPFEILFTTFSQKKMSKYPENKSLWTKISYFAQLRKFKNRRNNILAQLFGISI